MGFFSVNCLACGHSLRSAHTHGRGHWTNYAVVFTQHGSRVIGEYDGYGRVGPDDPDDDSIIGSDDVSAYHRACWMIVGQPNHFTVPSDDAYDQGYFVASEPPKPATLEDLAALRATVQREREEARKAMADARESLGQ
jgi:hypothetical protein